MKENSLICTTRIRVVFGRFLWESRKRSKFSRQEIANRLGLSLEQITRYERGSEGIPCYLLSEMLRLYGVPMRAIMGLYEELGTPWETLDLAQAAQHRLQVDLDIP